MRAIKKSRHLLVGLTILLLAENNLLAQAPPNIPPQVIQSWNYFMGEWEISGSISNVSITGGAVFDWAAGRQCFFAEQIWLFGKEEKPIEFTSLSGWDARAKQTIESGFSSSGGSAIVRYATDLTNPNAKRTIGKAQGVSPANATPWAGDAILDRISNNEFRLTTIVNGQPVHQLTYRRVRSPQKQPPQ